MTELILYSTSHCHLCEQAEALLTQLAGSLQLQWQTIEIANDDGLLFAYGTRIPVIKIKDKSADLGWPFTAKELIDFIEQP